jgi:hypothetical protein
MIVHAPKNFVDKIAKTHLLVSGMEYRVEINNGTGKYPYHLWLIPTSTNKSPHSIQFIIPFSSDWSGDMPVQTRWAYAGTGDDWVGATYTITIQKDDLLTKRTFERWMTESVTKVHNERKK